MDREKVIKAWEIFRDSNPYEICSGREFRAIREPEYCMGQMIEDTIALLKEQEAVIIKKTKEHGFGVYGGICPKCRNWIQSAHSFCGFCGQAVKWE